jgi:HlyD family secretion protein
MYYEYIVYRILLHQYVISCHKFRKLNIFPMKLLLKVIKPLFLIFFVVTLTACGEEHPYHNGYIETRLVFISSPFSGELVKRYVKRGDLVKKGQLLFKLESFPELPEMESSKALLEQSLASLENLQLGKRAPYLKQTEALIKKAKSNVTFLEKELVRIERLSKRGYSERKTLDQSKNKLQVAQAELKSVEMRLKQLKLPARAHEIMRAEAKVKQMRYQLQKTAWKLKKKIVYSPLDGAVYDTYYHLGEQVPARESVMSIRNPHQNYLIYFLPEEEMSKINIGSKVKVLRDGFKNLLDAKVTYISPQAEYTPPVIYSDNTRAKLVYRIEARSSALTQLNRGQVVTVYSGSK